jgi:hypothetical protein
MVLAQHTFGIDLPIAQREPARSWRRLVARDSFVLAAPQLKTHSGFTRLWRELLWGAALRSLRWNLLVMASVSFARLRWRIFRSSSRWP